MGDWIVWCWQRSHLNTCHQMSRLTSSTFRLPTPLLLLISTRFQTAKTGSMGMICLLLSSFFVPLLLLPLFSFFSPTFHTPTSPPELLLTLFFIPSSSFSPLLVLRHLFRFYELQKISTTRQWNLVKVNINHDHLQFACKHNVYPLTYPATTIMGKPLSPSTLPSFFSIYVASFSFFLCPSCSYPSPSLLLPSPSPRCLPFSPFSLLPSPLSPLSPLSPSPPLPLSPSPPLPLSPSPPLPLSPLPSPLSPTLFSF